MAKTKEWAWFPGALATLKHRPVSEWDRNWAKTLPDHRAFFSSWKAAHDWMIARAMKRLEKATREAESARKHLEKVMSIKDPEANQNG